jgi:glucan biosynthesis protein C
MQCLGLLRLGTVLALIRSSLEVNTHLGFYEISHSDWQLNILATVATWSLVIGILYTFKNFFNKESKSISYFVDGSYFIYLIHLPIIVFLQVVLNRVDIHWLLKFPIATLGSLFFSLIIYHFWVKGKFIDRFLKGSY